VSAAHHGPFTPEIPMPSNAETDFMEAMKAYKQASGRMFPTWSEALEVLHSLGYEKVGAGPRPPDDPRGPRLQA
jgi:hypothetical protein